MRRRRERGTWRVAVALSAALAASACATSATTKYTHPNMDLGAVKRVAVLPFENLTQDRSASEKVQKIFLTELLSLEAFDVVEPGQVTQYLRANRIDSIEGLTPTDLKKLGEALKAQGIFTGSVVDYAETRTGQTPAADVTIQLRLVEAQSGVTVWSTSRTRSGATASARLFGIGGQSLTEAARQLIKEELGTLVK
jgi:TolB-like protein